MKLRICTPEGQMKEVGNATEQTYEMLVRKFVSGWRVGKRMVMVTTVDEIAEMEDRLSRGIEPIEMKCQPPSLLASVEPGKWRYSKEEKEEMVENGITEEEFVEPCLTECEMAEVALIGY